MNQNKRESRFYERKLLFRNFYVCFVSESGSSKGGDVNTDKIFDTKTV